MNPHDLQKIGPANSQTSDCEQQAQYLPRIEINARRNEPCQHQATAEYQAARLGKLLRGQPGQAQTEMANLLLQELVEAYRLALHNARQG